MQRNLSQYNSKRGKSIFPSVSSGLAIKLGGITRIISFLAVYWSVISDSVKARWWFKLARLYRAKITWHDQYLRKWKTTEICQPLCQNRHLCHRPFLLGQAESAFSLTESDFFRLLFSLFSTDQSSGVTLLRLHVKPNVPDMSTGYHTRFPGFLTTLVEGFSSKLFYRNLSQKVKGKRPKLTNIKQKDSVDIEGILKRPGAVVGSAEPLVVDSSETTKGIEIKKWQASRQRTNLLKQGERRCTFQVFYSQFRRN